MARMTFGSVLQEARERKGYDLSTAARRLRIRPDILRAIESNDFSRMPPRGYTRNMVNAYARLLGLNPTEITRMYLDEAYAYQVGRARSDVKPASGFDMGDAARTRRSSRPARQEEEPVEHVPRQNAFGRALYDDRTAYSRADYGQRDGTSSGSDRRYSEGRTHASRHTALPTTQYTNFYAGPKAPNGVQSKLPFIIAGVVILVLLIVVLVLVFGNKGNSSGDVPKVPVTGLTDTTQNGQGDGEQQQQQQQAPVEVAPTSVQVIYEVAKGQDPYAVITVDGTASQVFLTAGSKEAVEVTGTWSLACWMSDSVTVTVNGEKVGFDTTDANGVPMVTVDFSTYLEKWKTDHPNAATSGAKGTSGADSQASNAGTSGTGGSTGTSSSA